MTSESYKGLCGLSNLGNTCYMNSAIQCLSNTVPLTNYFLNDKYTEDYNTSKIEHNLVREWVRLINGIWSNSGCIITPRSFHKVTKVLSEKLGYNVSFGNFTQNDVQEYLVFVINMFHEALCSKIIVRITGKIVNDLDKLALEAMKTWKTFFKDSYSIITELFYSQLFSITKCPECNYNSIVYNPICYHTLPIPDKQNVTLYDCYETFTEKETLDSDNMWKCEKCNKHQCPERKVLLWSSPKILIICLKRFINNLSKKNTLVSFPINNLDLRKYCIGYDKDNSKYQLYGVCNHSGVLMGGHYYAYCKMNNKWHKFNDSTVSEISESKVVTSSAYCLFYRKIDTTK